jgi:hypothetical protein
MADARIEMKVGAVSFSAEGDGKWVSEQLDKFLDKIQELAKVKASQSDGEPGASTQDTTPKSHAAKGTLAGFLKAKSATTNQNRKFLATAVWLHDRKSQKRLTTKEVVTALADNHQKSLGNAPDCLNRNVTKGFCEKVDKEFFVTDEGRAELD